MCIGKNQAFCILNSMKVQVYRIVQGEVIYILERLHTCTTFLPCKLLKVTHTLQSERSLKEKWLVVPFGRVVGSQVWVRDLSSGEGPFDL